MTKTLDQIAVGYLLDDNQPALKKLMEVQRLALGLLCPHCGNTKADTIQTNNDGDEAFCESCEEYWSPGEAAADVAVELGIELEVRYR